MSTTGGGFNYTLSWKTFDSLLSDVRVDFSNYALENLIDPASLIRVARRCNYDLGLRIYQTKEALLDIEKGRVKLPDSFYSMNFAMMCGSYTETFALPQGTNMQEVSGIPQYRSTPANLDVCSAPIICPVPVCNCGCTPCSCPVTDICADAVYNPLEPYGDFCRKPRVFLNCKSECMELIQIVNTTTRIYNHLYPLKFITNAQGIECGCPGLYFRCADEAWIKDGWLYTNFNYNNGCGKVYINFQGILEDDAGNLLVPDHEVITEYYEAALKERICENLLMQGEDMERKLQYWSEKRKLNKGAAKAIVRMPNFAEMQEMYQKNRNAQWNKYYSDFSSYGWFDYNSALRSSW